MYDFRIVNIFRKLFYFLCTFFVNYDILYSYLTKGSLNMGDGKRLKEILDKQGMSVRKLAKETSISPTTLYSIIQKDTGIRYDFALRISNVLNIDVDDICSDAGLKKEDWDNENKIILPELPQGLNSVLDGNRIKRYLKFTLYPLMEMFGKNNMPLIDAHLTNYYQLTDEARAEVDQFINAQLKINRDPERAKQVKSIKGW